MYQERIFEQCIVINTNLSRVEKCITDLKLMHRWLNPMLRCEPVGDWGTNLGDRSRFVIKLPLLQPSLHSVVMERAEGLVVWQFDGFFQGCDRWECQSINEHQTKLINRFQFTIPNPLVNLGFQLFAAQLTKKDMEQQLQRLKKIAENMAI
jgi:hypothetical protein